MTLKSGSTIVGITDTVVDTNAAAGRRFVDDVDADANLVRCR